MNGRFADLAVVMLDRDVPAYADIIELPDTFPGNWAWGAQVGRGNHEGRSNPGSTLLEAWSFTYSAHVDAGHFLVEAAQTDPGDSGGPFYLFNHGTGRYEAQGVLYGRVWEWAWRNKYTSLVHHLDWIMFHTGYGTDRPWRTDSFINGTYIGMERVRQDRCVLSCAKDGNCAAVAFRPVSGSGYCYKFSSVNGYVPWRGISSTPVTY